VRLAEQVECHAADARYDLRHRGACSGLGRPAVEAQLREACVCVCVSEDV
jgi:hypothetical protein